MNSNPTEEVETMINNETEKPPFLFHASSNRDIAEFEPRARSIRHPDEGPRVFAKESAAAVSVFMVPSDDSWSQKSSWSSGKGEKTIVSIYSDRDRFVRNDKGGSIYELPSDTFDIDQKFSGSSKEWTSAEPVTPSKKTDYDSGLDAMLDFGVQVYFVSPEQLKEMRTAEDHGYSLLGTLTSENEKTGRNFIPLSQLS